LPGLDVIDGDRRAAADVFLAVDSAQNTRLDLRLPLFRAAATRIDLDHHATNLGFGDINLVEPDAASSCELVYELIRRMGGVPSTEEATALYTGIVTDTGRFQYSSTSPATLRVAADLREQGVDHTMVSTETFEFAPFRSIHSLEILL